MWQEWKGGAGVQFVDVPKTSRRIVSEWLQSNLADAPKRELAAQAVEVEHSIRPSDSSSEGDRERAGNPSTAKQEVKDHNRDAVARLRSEPDNRRGPTRTAR